ncbi:MAG: hypothetical protein FWH36_02360 [Lentimicrobiaceae bacterium]|nr:hypothetical protein [Lentimicrobiaceae bacterium]
MKMKKKYKKSKIIQSRSETRKDLDEQLDMFIRYVLGILWLGGLIFLKYEIETFDNTIHGTKLFLTAGAIGIALAIVLIVILKKIFPFIYYNVMRKYTVYVGSFVGFFTLTTAVVGFSNRFYADDTKICKPYTIVRKQTKGRPSRKEYYIHLKGNDIEERFSVNKSKYDSFSEGEEIELCIVNGKFNYDYVTDFNKIHH